MFPIAEALDLAVEDGFRIFPLNDPGPNGKQPRFNGWQRAATSDADQVRAWWAGAPNANVGIACGGAERLIVLDVDPAKGGRESLAALEAQFGALPETRRAHTGSGGEHVYMRVPAGLPMPSNRVEFRPGLDLRSEGGFVVAPPSVHQNGRPYAWSCHVPVRDAPTWFYALVALEAPRKVEDANHTPRTDPPLEERIQRARGELARLPPAVSGHGGHNALLRAATTVYRGFDLPREAARALLEEYNASCAPAWSSAELEHKLDAVETNERSGEFWGFVLEAEDMAAALAPTPEETRAQATAVGVKTAGAIEWIGWDEIEKPLPPVEWIVPDLQICAGRPTMIAGYGSSGKTILAQSMALAVASGRLVWNAFAHTKPRRVRHLDHDQGSYATRRRYQRLAAGLGVGRAEIEDRLSFAAHPAIYLNQNGAREAYLLACAGADLVLIDALRGATPGQDENDSAVRSCIDVLSWVSEKIGTAFVLIHHAGKVSGEDKRTGPRGSSAIFDGCGCVLQIEADPADPHGPKSVHQTKSAAEAEAGTINPFGVSIDDEADGALVVRFRAFEKPQTADEIMGARKDAIVAWVEGHPGASQNGVKIGVGGNRETTVEAIRQLVKEGTLINRAANPGDGLALFTRNNDRGDLV